MENHSEYEALSCLTDHAIAVAYMNLNCFDSDYPEKRRVLDAQIITRFCKKHAKNEYRLYCLRGKSEE